MSIRRKKNNIRSDFPERSGRAKRKRILVFFLLVLALGAGSVALLYSAGGWNRRAEPAAPPRTASSAGSPGSGAESRSSSSPASQAGSGSSSPVAVAAERLNIRSGCGTDCGIVCTVAENTELKPTGATNADGTWVEVETPEGKTGWCCRAYLNMDAVSAFSFQGLTAPLSVQVSLARQEVTVTDAKGVVVKKFVCSAGRDDSETPTGIFAVSGRGRSFFNAGIQEGAFYWTRFYGDYLFHSIPFDENYKTLPAEAAKLGTAASHGCIRLSLADAKWIYDYIPDGTRVTIR